MKKCHHSIRFFHFDLSDSSLSKEPSPFLFGDTDKREDVIRNLHRNEIPEDTIHGEQSQRKSLQNLPFYNMPEGHSLVLVGISEKTGCVKQKDCRYCSKYSVKTKSGYTVRTQYKCSGCDVALCSGELTGRNCFVLFHNELFLGV